MQYKLEEQLMSEKLQGSLPFTETLYHGTSKTDPMKIVNSEEGFDLRFANSKCLWGKALYFSISSSYSHEYAYQLPLTREQFKN